MAALGFLMISILCSCGKAPAGSVGGDVRADTARILLPEGADEQDSRGEAGTGGPDIPMAEAADMPDSRGEAGKGGPDIPMAEATDMSDIPTAEGAIDVQDKMKHAIVRIKCGGSVASGVILDINEQEIQILSCKHLLKKGGTCSITLPREVTYPATVSELSDETDIGIAVISASDVERTDLEYIRSVQLSDRFPDDMVLGESLFLYGSSEYVGSEFRAGYLIETDVMMEGENLEPGSSMLIGSGDAKAGMSGCGIFDEDGYLVALMSGIDEENRQFMAVPVWQFRDAVRLTSSGK